VFVEYLMGFFIQKHLLRRIRTKQKGSKFFLFLFCFVLFLSHKKGQKEITK